MTHTYLPTLGGELRAPRAPHHPLRGYRAAAEEHGGHCPNFATEERQLAPGGRELP